MRGAAGAEAYDAGGGIGLITGADGFLAGTGTVSSWLHFGQSTFLPAAVAGAASFLPHGHVTVILEGAGLSGAAPGIWKIFLQAGQRAVLPASFSGTLRTLPQLHVTCMGDPPDVRRMQAPLFYETAPPLSMRPHTAFSMDTISYSASPSSNEARTCSPFFLPMNRRLSGAR